MDRYYCNLDKELLTLLKEVKLVLNCRPLTRVSPNLKEWHALIPGTFFNDCMEAALTVGIIFANPDNPQRYILAAIEIRIPLNAPKAS